MGLDIALGVIVLVAGIRGWFKGFVLQAIHIGGLVGSIYLASPLRDLARPFAREYFPGVQPELMDRLLWWTAGVVAYIVVTGVAVSTVRLYRRRHYLEGLDRDRGDQGAGFLLGGLKGALLVIFLAAGIARHSPAYVQSGGWIAQQVARSRSIQWTNSYHPAEQVWASVPVQTIVRQVRREGLWSDPVSTEPRTRTAEEGTTGLDRGKPPLPTSLPPRTLRIPAPQLDPRSPRFLEDVDQAIQRELDAPTRR